MNCRPGIARLVEKEWGYLRDYRMNAPAGCLVLTSSRGADDLGVALTEAASRGFIPKEMFTGAAFARLLLEPELYTPFLTYALEVARVAKG